LLCCLCNVDVAVDVKTGFSSAPLESRNEGSGSTQRFTDHEQDGMMGTQDEERRMDGTGRDVKKKKKVEKGRRWREREKGKKKKKDGDRHSRPPSSSLLPLNSPPSSFPRKRTSPLAAHFVFSIFLPTQRFSHG